MKRQSKAEEALKKQIMYIDHRIDTLTRDWNNIQQQIEAIRKIREQLDREVGRLETERKRASQSRKP